MTAIDPGPRCLDCPIWASTDPDPEDCPCGPDDDTEAPR